MKWNFIKDGVLPKDCELVVGIICWRGFEYVYSLEYRSVTRAFIVKSAERGYHHVVMENLDNSFGKCYANDEHDVNYNRRVKFLGLSSIKDKFEHIGRKYDIAVSLVHPCYTSKQCPVCGCIDDDNRKTQEEFKCVQCGHEANADINAALNIKNRVSVTVLRKLLKQSDNGSFKPKPLKRAKVKEVLLSFRDNIGNNIEKFNLLTTVNKC